VAGGVLGFTAADFSPDGVLRPLLKRRWLEITAHSASATEEGQASYLFHLAFYLDPALDCNVVDLGDDFALGIQSPGVCALNGVKLVQEVCPETDYTFTFGAHVLGRSKDKNVATNAASELERGPPLMYWAFQGTNSCLKDLAGIVFRLPATVCSGKRTSNVMRGAAHNNEESKCDG
jgi:hypothetical protein